MFSLNEPPHRLNYSLGEDQLLFHKEGSLGPGAHCATIRELNKCPGMWAGALGQAVCVERDGSCTPKPLWHLCWLQPLLSARSSVFAQINRAVVTVLRSLVLPSVPPTDSSLASRGIEL